MADDLVAQYLAVALIGFLGTFCYAVASFGRAIVVHMVWSFLALVLASSLANQYVHVVVLITIQGVLIFPLQIWFVRKDILWRAIVLICSANVVMVVVASYILFEAPVWIIKYILAAVFLMFGLFKVFEELKAAYFDDFLKRYLETLSGGGVKENLVRLFSEKRTPPFKVEMFASWSTITLPLMGITMLAGGLSGLLQGISGVGGPPMIIWTMQMNMDKLTLRGTSAFMLGISAVTQAAYLFGFKQQFESARWLEYLVLVIFSLAGLYLGNKAHDKLDVATITRILLLFLLLASMSMVPIPLLALWISYLIVATLGIFLLFQSKLVPLLVPKGPMVDKMDDPSTKLQSSSPAKVVLPLDSDGDAVPSRHAEELIELEETRDS